MGDWARGFCFATILWGLLAGFSWSIYLTFGHEWHWGHSDPGVTLITSCLVVVAIIQAGLFFYQLAVMRDTLKEAANTTKASLLAAEAAKTNAQALIDAERAYLWPGFQPPRIEIKGGIAFIITVLNT